MVEIGGKSNEAPQEGSAKRNLALIGASVLGIVFAWWLYTFLTAQETAPPNDKSYYTGPLHNKKGELWKDGKLVDVEPWAQAQHQASGNAREGE